MIGKYPKNLLTLITFLKKLPGVGSKSAERFAFHMLKWNEKDLQELGLLLTNIKKNIKHCENCGCIISEANCIFCDPKLRDTSTICIISSPKDAFSIQQTNTYRGLYHVVGKLLSPFNDYKTEELHLDRLKQMVERYKITEVILAFGSTIEEDATALFFKKWLKGREIKVSRLAFGLPLGISLEYVDGGTLTKAFSGRQIF